MCQKLFFVFLVLVLTGPVEATMNLEAGSVRSNNSSGQFYDFTWSKKYAGTSIGLTYNKESRYFINGALIGDEKYGAFVYQKLTKEIYIEGNGQTSTIKNFFPDYSVSLIPHFVFSTVDFWVGIRHSQYGSRMVSEARIGFLNEINDNWNWGSQIFLLMANPDAQSVHAFSNFQIQHFKNRIDFGSGRTLEAANLIGRFTSLALRSLYTAYPLQFGLGCQFYDGSVRDESRFFLILNYPY